MLKKVLFGALAFVILASIGLFFWARAVFTQDNVRTSLAAQLSNSFGQPVTIGGIGAAVYPRVTVNLRHVAIGQPPRIQIETLHVGTDVRALLSRRIEHAVLRLTGARIELPLPEFGTASTPTPTSGTASGSWPVEIVSIDEIVLGDVQVMSGGRMLHGDIEIVPQGKGFTVRKLTLVASDTTIHVTGQISDPSGPLGELSVKTDELNFDRLLAFVSDFAGSAGASTSGGAAPAVSRRSGTAAKTAAMNIAVSLEADRATMGSLSLKKLSGRAKVTSDTIRLEPTTFGLFGGNFQGALLLTLGSTTAFRLNATLSDLDTAAAMKFAGSPDTITGRLAGKIALSGRGMDASSVLRTAGGTARVDITNGIVKRLGLVRSVIIATSGRAGASPQGAGVSSDEPFTRLGATLTLADGSASTQDLSFESNDLLLEAAGRFKLDGSAIDLAGPLHLSEKLSQQAGRDLVRYTQDQGRVTLPVRITGSADNPQVGIEVASVARQAITNRAQEEAQKAIKRGLGQLLGR